VKRIALLQTDLALDRSDVEITKYGLSSSDRDTVVSALKDADILVCDMNLLREDSFKFLLDIQDDLQTAISRGAGLICLTTRPTIRTSSGTKNVYAWVPDIGTTLKVTDDLVTKVVQESGQQGPELPSQIIASLFATCAFDGGSLDGANAFLVSEDKTPVGVFRATGSGFIMLLPQSEDKKSLLTEVVSWSMSRRAPAPPSVTPAEPPVQSPVETAPPGSDADDVMDLGSAAEPAASSGDSGGASGVDASIASMDDLQVEGDTPGASAEETSGDGDAVMDLGALAASTAAAEPEHSEEAVSTSTLSFDAPGDTTSHASPPAEDVPAADDPFSKRLSFDPASLSKAPAPEKQAAPDQTVFMPRTESVAAVPAPAPATAAGESTAGESSEFDKAFNLDSPDPFGSLETSDWPGLDSPAGGGETKTADPVPEPAPESQAPPVAAPVTVEAPAAPVSTPDAPAPAASVRPDWIDELHSSLPGLSDIIDRQRDIRIEIQKLEDEHAALQAKRGKVDGWTPLVTGEPETFHRAVRNFFGNILSTSTEITGQGLIVADAGIGKFLVLPVTKEGLAKADVGRLLLHALADADVQTKGVLVVNQEREKNALQRAPLEQDLIELSRRRDFVLLPSILLYRVAVQHALDLDPPNAIDLVQLIYSSAGPITILR